MAVLIFAALYYKLITELVKFGSVLDHVQPNVLVWMNKVPLFHQKSFDLLGLANPKYYKNNVMSTTHREQNNS